METKRVMWESLPTRADLTVRRAVYIGVGLPLFLHCIMPDGTVDEGARFTRVNGGPWVAGPALLPEEGQ
jgi:hypothetical protein